MCHVLLRMILKTSKMERYHLNAKLNVITYVQDCIHIVAENKRRQDINEELLGRFYIDQDVVTIRSTDKLPADAYLDENLPYTRTGRHVLTLSPRGGGGEGIRPPPNRYH